MGHYKYPCQDCQDRTVGCHSKCEKYLTVREERWRQNTATWKKQNEDAMFEDYKIKIIHETKKRFERRK